MSIRTTSGRQSENCLSAISPDSQAATHLSFGWAFKTFTQFSLTARSSSTMPTLIFIRNCLSFAELTFRQRQRKTYRCSLAGLAPDFGLSLDEFHPAPNIGESLAARSGIANLKAMTVIGNLHVQPAVFKMNLELYHLGVSMTNAIVECFLKRQQHIAPCQCW